MKSRNSKTHAGGGLAWASKDSAKINLQVDPSKRSFLAQPEINLTALLRSYKFGLLSLPYDNHISRLVDCCDFILDEGGLDD